jgi:hypothetical protein
MRIGGLSKLGVSAARLWSSSRLGALLVFAVAALLVAPSAGAVPCDLHSCSFAIQEFIGADSEVTFTLEDLGSSIQMTAAVTHGDGDDIRWIYFDVADDSLLDGLSIIAVPLQGESPIIDVGSGGTLRGGGPPVSFDVGVEVGTPGKKDFFDTITLVIMHDTLDLDLSLFSEQLFGARTTSRGRKLRGEAPVVIPEPTTAGLVSLGLAMLSVAGRRRS